MFPEIDRVLIDEARIAARVRDMGRQIAADLQRDVAARAQAPHRGHDVEAGAHRPLGIVLVRMRVAEAGQQPVARVLGDDAG